MIDLINSRIGPGGDEVSRRMLSHKVVGVEEENYSNDDLCAAKNFLLLFLFFLSPPTSVAYETALAHDSDSSRPPSPHGNE